MRYSDYFYFDGVESLRAVYDEINFKAGASAPEIELVFFQLMIDPASKVFRNRLFSAHSGTIVTGYLGKERHRIREVIHYRKHNPEGLDFLVISGLFSG